MSLLTPIGKAAFRIAGVVAPPLAGKAAYYLFCLPPRITAGDPARARLTEKLGPLRNDALPFRIANPDATIQAYLWRTTKAPARGRVLLVHGWTAEALIMGLFVKPLRDAGFDVVALDLPAHGTSTGRLLNMPIGARAVLAVADRLGAFTGIVTHSFGGPISALAIEGGSPIGRKIDVDKLVLISSPHSIAKTARDFGDGFAFSDDLQQRLGAEVTRAAGRRIEAIKIGDMLATAGKPALIIHDTEDDRVPFTEAEAIVASAGGHATLMQTTGLGHEWIVIMPSIVRAAVRFLAGESAR